jgi:polysaccharide biosynthesis/export protein
MKPRRKSRTMLLANNNVILIVTLAFVTMFSACLYAGQDSPKKGSAEQTEQATGVTYSARAQEANRPALQRRDGRYQLQPGDSFTVSFPFTPEFNQPDVAVQPDGYATLQGLGEIPAAGKTLPELRELVQSAYSNIVSPQVITVELKNFEKPYFLVSGEVERPGKFDLRGDTTVTQAVAVAGGFRDSAKHSQVLLFRRVSDQWMEAKKLDLKKMLKAGNLSEDLHLRPGDMIYVPKNALSKIRPFMPVPTVGTTLSPPLY